VATLVETLNVAVQRDDKDELSSAERLRRLNTECGFMYGEGALKGRFVEGVHRAARATVRERNTPGITMAELARVAQTKGDEHRWHRLELLKKRTKEQEVRAEDPRLRRQALLAASPRVSGGARGYPPRDAPVRVVGAVDASNPGDGARHDASRPGTPHWLDSRRWRQLTPPIPAERRHSSSQTQGGRVPLLAVWQDGPLGRGVPNFGRTPT